VIAELFWQVLAWAAVLWYSTLTVYVAFKGVFDIKKMLRELQRGEDRKKP
jgi:hypothetical protein